jgi:FtsP/CotA-like multicopper oxidase with cupredoxin domain
MSGGNRRAKRIMRWFAPALIVCALALALGATIMASAVNATEVTFVLRIENGQLPENMRLIRVKQNDVVKLEWSADRPTTIHLHGYDIEKEITPGATTDMTFTACATGRFTVEPHLARAHSGGHTHGDVLVTIEVYP